MDQTYPTRERGGPTKLWIFVVGTGVFLLIVFWFPWITFAQSDIQQANYDWIAKWMTPGWDVEIIHTLLDNLNIDPESFDPVNVIDAGGWGDLRLAIAARRGVGGGWLLVSRFTAPLRLRIAAQVLLIVSVAVWSIANAKTQGFQTAPAIILLVFTILITLAHIFSLPKLDTLGRDDSFSLALLMAIVLARPGLGFWLTLIGNAALAMSMVVYLGLESPAWRKSGGLEQSFYEGATTW